MAKHIPHAIYTLQERLELVIAAQMDIAATGQQHKIAGKELTWATLGELVKEETRLENRIAGSAIATNFTRHGRNGGSLIKT
ncbi:MAG: hypothetical protein O7D91_21355 [Planctomycetota bacterium]|nr:hypothetical protein [Planctomycetota bacterium]